MADYRLLNGKPRATLIQRTTGSVLLIGPKGKTIEFRIGTKLLEVKTEAEKLGWAIAVEHLHSRLG